MSTSDLPFVAVHIDVIFRSHSSVLPQGVEQKAMDGTTWGDCRDFNP